MNDWYNDPPDHPEPPEWYALIEEAIGNDPPPAISTAIRKLIDDWNEEQNRMQGEPDPPAATGVEARVCQDIAARQRLGIAKYGVTVAESQDDMLRHAYEEALDLSVYLKSEIERRQRPQ
jgi:hypothetical protein